ncbi:hypothetical protein DFH09DRAFT_1350004 [Mycena vulgaris]|nr:hypothetical protein DFH09DRAFT_1350004 [Mycena vulgaris]
MQLEQDAPDPAPNAPERPRRRCTRRTYDPQQQHRHALWFRLCARILNPTVDADSIDQHPHPASAPEPPSASGRNLHDLQPLRSLGSAFPSISRCLRDTQPPSSIGAAFPPVPRLDSGAADGDGTLPAVRALFPAAFTRTVPAPTVVTPATTRGDSAPPTTAGDAAPRNLCPPGDPFPTAPTSAGRVGVDVHGARGVVPTDVHGVVEADAQMPPAQRATRRCPCALPAYLPLNAYCAHLLAATDAQTPHALNAASEDENNIFVYDPYAFASATNAQRDPRPATDVYHPHPIPDPANGFAITRTPPICILIPSPTFASMRTRRPGVRVRSDAGVGAGVAYSEKADDYYPQVLVADAYPYALGDDADVYRNYGFAGTDTAAGAWDGDGGKGASSPRVLVPTYTLGDVRAERGSGFADAGAGSRDASRNDAGSASKDVSVDNASDDTEKLHDDYYDYDEQDARGFAAMGGVRVYPREVRLAPALAFAAVVGGGGKDEESREREQQQEHAAASTPAEHAVDPEYDTPVSVRAWSVRPGPSAPARAAPDSDFTWAWVKRGRAQSDSKDVGSDSDSAARAMKKGGGRCADNMFSDAT